MLSRIDTGTDFQIVCYIEVPIWFQLWMASLRDLSEGMGLPLVLQNRKEKDERD